MLPSFRFALAAGLLCLAACQRAPDTDGATPPPSPRASTPAAGAATAATPAATPATPAGATPQPAGADVGDDGIADHYACDAGARLSRKDDGSFRAEIPGNPPVRLARIAGSHPPVFTGASLYLRIEGTGEAILSQGDLANELRCKPGQAPA